MDTLFFFSLLLFNIIILICFQNHKKQYIKLRTPLIITINVISLVILIYLIYNTRKKEKMNNQNGGNNSSYRERKRRALLNKCGLPNRPETSHCFNDGTHHTCCMLSKGARTYADGSSNPIGEVSERMYKIKHNLSDEEFNKISANTKTPWCTCSGSSVCSEYHRDIDSKTNIKFMNCPNNKEIRKNVNPNCEKHFTHKFRIGRHRTPGVGNDNSSNNNPECNKTPIEIINV